MFATNLGNVCKHKLAHCSGVVPAIDFQIKKGPPFSTAVLCYKNVSGTSGIFMRVPGHEENRAQKHFPLPFVLIWFGAKRSLFHCKSKGKIAHPSEDGEASRRLAPFDFLQASVCIQDS
jgi:hypothetical protein